MSYQTRNWITATLAASLLVALAAVLGALSGQRSADPLLKRPSTFFTDASGARALLLVMKQLLPSVEQWRRPLNSLPAPADEGSASTLIVAGPRTRISTAEADHLDRWLSTGGQLILATGDGWPVTRRMMPEDEEDLGKDFAEGSKKGAVENGAKRQTYLSRHAPELQWSKPGAVNNGELTGSSVPTEGLKVQWKQEFSAAEGVNVVAAAGDSALAVKIPVGKGRIVVVADPTIVSNQALREADNAVWLVSLAAGWGNGRVLVDEFHHGFGKKRGVSALTWAFLQTPWGWCVLQLVAAGLLYVFGYRRRFGRISEPPPAPRTSPLELIDARAGLFQAAAAKGMAVELICQNLCQDLAKAYGKPVDLPTLSYSLEASDKTGSSAKLFTRLRVLSSKAAQGEKLTDQEFVEVGRIAGQILQGSPT